jgi:hypothetical protein
LRLSNRQTVRSFLGLLQIPYMSPLRAQVFEPLWLQGIRKGIHHPLPDITSRGKQLPEKWLPRPH